VKVLHVIPAIARRYGGPSSAIRALCGNLAQLPDTQVEVATTDADGAGSVVRESDFDAGVLVHLFPRSCSERWKYSWQMSRWLHRHAGRYDIVHIHGLWSHACSAAAAAARRCGTPYIVRPAGMLSKYSLRRRSWSKRTYWWWCERSTVRGAAAVHATSRLERGDVLDACPSARVFVIANGVEESAWQAQNKAREVRDHVTGDRPPVLLFLSRLHPKKGLLDLLLPAVVRMRSQAVLLVAGGADEHAPEFANKVSAEIARLKLEDRVQLLGPVSPDDRWTLFDRADVFVLPSHSENFGIVVAEAMARRRPVLITDAVQICDHVQSAGAGVVVGCEITEIAAALDTLVVDGELRRRMGQAGQAYARAHFAWRAIARDVRRMYESVLTSPQPELNVTKVAS